jgi:hypothetical protein
MGVCGMKAPAGTHLLRGGMADVLASGASVRKYVGVQVPLSCVELIQLSLNLDYWKFFGMQNKEQFQARPNGTQILIENRSYLIVGESGFAFPRKPI